VGFLFGGLSKGVCQTFGRFPGKMFNLSVAKDKRNCTVVLHRLPASGHVAAGLLGRLWVVPLEVD